MDKGQWTLLLKRPHRRQLWRAAFGALLVLALLDGGFHSTPRWLGDVTDVLVFFFSLWLIFSAGFAFHRSVIEQGPAEPDQATEIG